MTFAEDGAEPTREDETKPEPEPEPEPEGVLVVAHSEEDDEDDEDEEESLPSGPPDVLGDPAVFLRDRKLAWTIARVQARKHHNALCSLAKVLLLPRALDSLCSGERP